MSYAMYLRKSRAEELAALESVEDVLERHYTALKELAEKQHITVDGKDIFNIIKQGFSLLWRWERNCALLAHFPPLWYNQY